MALAGPTQIRLQQPQEPWRHRTAFVNDEPSHTERIQEEFINITIGALAVNLALRIHGAHRDHTPGVNCRTSDQRCHCVLGCQELELYTVLPLEAFFEEAAHKLDAMTLSSTWDPEETRPHRLRQVLVAGSRKLAFLTLTAGDDGTQEDALLCCWWLGLGFFCRKPAVGVAVDPIDIGALLVGRGMELFLPTTPRLLLPTIPCHSGRRVQRRVSEFQLHLWPGHGRAPP